MGEAEGNSNPPLKLIILNGPLSGQTFNFIPGSKVQIGRIVRGNAVTIKDAGVSSKHLLIQFELNPGRWTISDLDSSNGTFLNGRLVDPFDPVPISNGDVIKIGEATSISVDIGVNEESMLRNLPRRRGRPRKDVNINDMNLGEIRSEDLDGMMDTLGKNEAKGKEMEACPIRTSNVKQGKVSGIWESSYEDGVGVRVVETEEISKGPKRVTRGRKKKEILNVDVGDLKERQDVSMKRTTRSMRQGKILESLEDNAGQGNRKIRKGKRGKQNVEEDTLRENVQLEKEEVLLQLDSRLDETTGARTDNMIVNEVAEISYDEAPVYTLRENVQLEKEEVLLQPDLRLDETTDARTDNMIVNEVAEISYDEAPADPSVTEKGVNLGVKGSLSTSGSKHHNNVVLDLGNMTIGDLFDHWEVSLPKQIIDATEQMISDMREKSKKFHEFRMQQKIAKDNINISIG